MMFFDLDRGTGRITSGPFVSDINCALCQRYIRWRKVQPSPRRIGHKISGATISRELAALHAALRHAWETEIIPSAPFVPDISEKDRPVAKDLVYSPQQVARLLEAALRIPERWHVHRFIMIMMSTHGRGEAILELDVDTQMRDNCLHFLVPGEVQTKKRRSIVPIAPALAPWLDGVTGPMIQYRTVDKGGNVFTRPTARIKTAFEACLIEAGISEQATDAEGKRQIDMAARHAPIGTNKKNYMHLRPGYLAGLIDAVGDYWAEVGKHTTAHMPYQYDTNVVELTARPVR